MLPLGSFGSLGADVAVVDSGRQDSRAGAVGAALNLESLCCLHGYDYRQT